MKHVPLLAALCLSVPLASQASLAGPRIFPRAARVPGRVDTRLDTVNAIYIFTLRNLANQALVEYRVPLRHANMAKGMLRVEESTTGIVPMTGGGALYRLSVPTLPTDLFGQILTPAQLAADPNRTTVLVSHSLDSSTGVVTLRYRDTYVGGGTFVAEKVYTLQLVGKALKIQLAGDETIRRLADHNHAGFSFGPGDGLATPNVALRIPYMDATPLFVGMNGGAPAYCTRMIDWYVSNSSDTLSTPPVVPVPLQAATTFDGESPPIVYHNNINEINAPIRETAYVVVSRTVEETFPVVDRPSSEYRLSTAGRHYTQIGPITPFIDGTQWNTRFAPLGFDEIQQINWSWMKWPLNLNEPDYTPGGTFLGTATDWQTYASQVLASNWGLAPYFEGGNMDKGYTSNPVLKLILFFNGVQTVVPVQLTANPIFDSLKCVRDANGNLKTGWDTELNLAGTSLGGQGIGHPVNILAPHLRARTIGAHAAWIQSASGFPTGGAHIDAKSDIPGWVEIDQFRQAGFDKTVAETLRSRESYFRVMKDTMAGPLLGENSHWRFRAMSTFDAGLIDGTSRKIPMEWDPSTGLPNVTCFDAEVIPDFELGEVMTKSSGFFGMGWETHFKKTTFPFPQAAQDEWFTTLLSFGHAPYLATNGDVLNNYWDWRGTLKSYYLVYGVSKAMRSSRMTQVRYVDGTGVERTLSEAIGLALLGQMDLKRPRLVVRYANGLEFRANHSQTNWATAIGGNAYHIPPNGFAAVGSNGLKALSILNPVGGARVDYAFNPGHSTMIDLRGVNQSYAGFPGTLYPPPPGTFPTNPALPLETVVVSDLHDSATYYGNEFQTGKTAGVGQSAATLRIDSDETSVLSVGRPRLGLRATLVLANGAERDVTGRVTWTSNGPSIATVSRFGAVAPVANVTQPITPGATSIKAVLPGTSLIATTTVTAQMLPIVSTPVLESARGASALLSCATDSACTSVVVTLRQSGTPTVLTFTGRPDPAQKRHVFDCTGLVPLATYTAVVSGTNAYGVAGTSGTGTFTMP